jgi:hypothetical protein
MQGINCMQMLQLDELSLMRVTIKTRLKPIGANATLYLLPLAQLARNASSLFIISRPSGDRKQNGSKANISPHCELRCVV